MADCGKGRNVRILSRLSQFLQTRVSSARAHVLEYGNRDDLMVGSPRYCQLREIRAGWHETGKTCDR